MEKVIEGTNSNEDRTMKKNIATYSNKTLPVPSATIGIKKKLHLPECCSIMSKQ